MKRISLLGFLGVLFCFFILPSHAEKVVITDPSRDNKQSFGALLPGEKINFHTGEVQHYMETVSIEGNGLPIKLGHSFVRDGIDNYNKIPLEIPRIEFMHLGLPYYSRNSENDDNGAVNGGYSTAIRCSNLRFPNLDIFMNENGGSDYSYNPPDPQSISHLLSSSVKMKIGYENIHFHPKTHEQTDRFPSSASLVSPSNWYIECVSSQNVTGNNAFKAVSPNGIEYIFDMYEESVSWQGRRKSLPAKIYLSQVTDKYGNSLNYSYNSFYYIETSA